MASTFTQLCPLPTIAIRLATVDANIPASGQEAIVEDPPAEEVWAPGHPRQRRNVVTPTRVHLVELVHGSLPLVGVEEANSFIVVLQDH